MLTVPGDPHSVLSCGEDGAVRWFDLRVNPNQVCVCVCDRICALILPFYGSVSNMEFYRENRFLYSKYFELIVLLGYVGRYILVRSAVTTCLNWSGRICCTPCRHLFLTLKGGCDSLLIQCSGGVSSMDLHPLLNYQLAVGSSDSCVRYSIMYQVTVKPNHQILKIISLY